MDPLTTRSADEFPLGAEWDLSSLLSRLDAAGRPSVLPDLEDLPAPPSELCWNARYQIRRMLGRGGQGVVYLAKREGVDGYHTNVALKMFYRPSGMTEQDYLEEMRRIARQAQRISRIQHDSIVDVRDFVELDGVRVMVLEWVDGLDLSRLLDLRRLDRLRRDVPTRIWEHLVDVIVEPGVHHGRLKPGIAVDILRGCLTGLSALHNHGIVHGDLKPSNIMLKRAGTKKIIDMDSSSVVDVEEPRLRGTPYYMSPEQLRGRAVHLRSDVASLGYILIEMLTGSMLFRHAENIEQLTEAKRRLPDDVDELLPGEVREDPILHGLIHKMIAFEPSARFADADAAELDRVGAVSFHRQLVQTGLDTEYARELSWWIELIHAHGLEGV